VFDLDVFLLVGRYYRKILMDLEPKLLVAPEFYPSLDRL
jgi:hypothetical protein